MKSIEVARACGGIKALRAKAKEIADKYGILVEAEPCVNEEYPVDNWMNILFEYPSAKSPEFIAARDEFGDFLSGKGLSYRYECSGDGATGIIMSYRVVGRSVDDGEYVDWFGLSVNGIEARVS